MIFTHESAKVHLNRNLYISLPNSVSLFLCLGHAGPLHYLQHGWHGELIQSTAMNKRGPPIAVGPFTSSPTLSPKQKSDKLSALDKSFSAVVCKQCGKHFSDLTKFKAHIAYHEKEGRFPCKYCGKPFHARANQVRHERIHTGEKPFECKFCNRGFNVLSACRKHESLKSCYQNPFYSQHTPLVASQVGLGGMGDESREILEDSTSNE